MKTKLNPRYRCSLVLLLLAAFLGSVTNSVAQEETKKPASETKTDEKKAEEKKPETNKEAVKKAEPITAIVGGDLHTVTGAVIRQGTILVQAGKILDVGQSIEIPEGATIVDAKGKVITPGFVAIDMQGIGIRSTPGNNEKLADALDPFDRNIKYSLGVGITTGCVELSSGGRGFGRRPRVGEAEERFPGLDPQVQEYVTEAMLDYGDENTSLCPCCGLPILPTEPITPAPPTTEQPRKLAVVKMSYGNLDAMLVKENAFYSPSPGALNGALNRHNWRRDVKKARESIKEKETAEQDKSKAASPSTTSSSTGRTAGGTPSPGTAPSRSGSTRGSSVSPELISLVKGEVAMRVRANTIDEIRDMVALAHELDYKIVIEGGVEAWAVAEELGSAKVGVIYTPRQRREPQPGREESSGSFIESPRIFQESGIPYAVAALSNSISMNGLAGRDLSSLPLEAAFAVRGGASEKSALEALTIAPARMMGLEDRIGSIEVGKDADLLILNGAPLDYRTYVEQAIVAGKVAYDRAKDKVYPVYDRVN